MKKTLVIDIETNAIDDFNTLAGLEKVHCICVGDVETGEVQRYNNELGSEGKPIQDCLEVLANADTLIAHNGIGFDFPALFKMFGFKHPHVLDTIILSRCIFPDLKTSDYRSGAEPRLCGSHSLMAWGLRLGEQKGNFGENNEWAYWTKAMEDYCVQDVVVTMKLFKHLVKQEPDSRMVRLEHEFARIIRSQEFNGFPFNLEKANDLLRTLQVKRAELQDGLQETFAPRIVKAKSRWWIDRSGNKFPTKKSMIEVGYKPIDCMKGDFKEKEVPFNPNSRDQICERLIEQGWKPTAYEGKRPAINEGVLKNIGTEPALKLLEFLMVSKRLAQLTEGAQGWLKLHKDGVIHGSVITNGAVSGRCTHNRPNVAQVPAVRAPYGAECRELFKAPEGKVLVGCDASGLELRCLAHVLHQWDDGAYANEILSGDIHTANQKAMGLETRDQAKTAIYCLIYGGGAAKLGQIVKGTAKEGAQLKARFEKAVPAYKKVNDAIKTALQSRDYLIGLDGRKLPVRSDHSALNLLLQSAGAVIMKKALILFQHNHSTKPFKLHANVHDEVQFSCAKEDAETLGQQFVNSIKDTAQVFDFKCPLDGEYSIGNNWKETH